MSFDFGGSGSGNGWGDAPPPPPPRLTGGGQSDDWNLGGGSPGPGAPEGPADPSPASMPASAPLVWLGLAGLAAVVAIVLGLVLDGFAMALVGWLIGGFVAIGLFAVYLKQDIAARAAALYAETGVAEWGRRAVVAFALVAVALNAWSMADVIARGGP